MVIFDKSKKFTIVRTDIEEVKRLNRKSGVSYNEAKNLLALKWLNRQK